MATATINRQQMEMGDQAGANDQSRRGFFSTNGIADEDRQQLLEIIKNYRQSWMTNRIELFRKWTRNVLFGKGIQVLQWDAAQNNWFDALQWYRENAAQQGENTNIEPFIVNVTLMLNMAFVGNLSTALPHPKILPEDARVARNVVSARSARTAVDILRRKNQAKRMLRQKFGCYYYFGCYFGRQRAVLDGEFGGWDETPSYEDMQVQPPARMKCLRCGSVNALPQGSGLSVQGQGRQLPRCQKCGAPLGPESYYAVGEGGYTSLKMTGTKKSPRPMVRMTVHSPLEIDADPKATEIGQTPILVCEREIDIGEARRLYGSPERTINEGLTSETSPNAELERLRRLEVYSTVTGQTADTNQSSVTLSEMFVTPDAYFRNGDYGFAGRMREKYPQGLCITNLGPDTVDIREACVTREWTHSALSDDFGLYPPSIAERVVPFNQRINKGQQLLDDHVQMGSLGLNFIDASRIDDQKMKGQQITSLKLIPVPMRVNGESRPLPEAFMHVNTPVDPQLWNYTQMLFTFLMVVAQIPPQVTGSGTQDGVETGMGQAQMLGQALTSLAPYWENVKVEDAQSIDNALWWLKRLMKTGALPEIFDVEEQQGDGYKNRAVSAGEMQGDVKIYADEDQALPVSSEQLRETMTLIFEQIGVGNTGAIAWADEPENQDMLMTSMAPGSVAPSESQRTKTLGDIAQLLEQQNWQPGMPLAATPDPTDDFTVAKPVFQKYMQQNSATKLSDPMAWERLNAYWGMLKEMESQVASEDAQRQMKVQQAGQPPKPQPSPQEAAEFQRVKDLSMQAMELLQQIAQMNPLLTKGSMTAQVAAARENVETGYKAAEMMAGSQA